MHSVCVLVNTSISHMHVRLKLMQNNLPCIYIVLLLCHAQPAWPVNLNKAIYATQTIAYVCPWMHGYLLC